jgi:glucose-1-phosphate thymidylyltransferase
MKIILPVAGKGTRLRPHTFSKPKSLLKVAGKTVLSHIIESLMVIDNAEFIFIVDSNGDVIKNYIESKYSISASYVVQKEQLGPAHAVWLAKDLIKDGDDILIVFNDTIAVYDYSKVVSLVSDSDGVIFAQKTDTPERFGIVKVDGGYISEIVEKPKDFIGDLAVVGIYYFKDGLKFMKSCDKMVEGENIEKGEYYMNYPIHDLIDSGLRFKAGEIDEWLDCGKPETLLSSNKLLLSKNNVNLGLVDNSVIIPPVFIPKNCSVKNSIIGPFVSLGDGCVVEHSIITDSIMDDYSKIKNEKLDNSIVGKNVCVLGSSKKINVGDNSIIDFSD